MWNERRSERNDSISFTPSWVFFHKHSLFLSFLLTNTHTGMRAREKNTHQPASVITKATVCHADAITKGIYSDLFCLPTCTTTTTTTPNICNITKEEEKNYWIWHFRWLFPSQKGTLENVKYFDLFYQFPLTLGFALICLNLLTRFRSFLPPFCSENVCKCAQIMFYRFWGVS